MRLLVGLAAAFVLVKHPHKGYPLHLKEGEIVVCGKFDKKVKCMPVDDFLKALAAKEKAPEQGDADFRPDPSPVEL